MCLRNKIPPERMLPNELVRKINDIIKRLVSKKQDTSRKNVP